MGKSLIVALVFFQILLFLFSEMKLSFSNNSKENLKNTEYKYGNLKNWNIILSSLLPAGPHLQPFFYFQTHIYCNCNSRRIIVYFVNQCIIGRLTTLNILLSVMSHPYHVNFHSEGQV